ncbi:MAG TPA: 2-amino-4-hydroxy-6-hydroxymethyldihydropteridine diphosphokinase [Candidatus Thermoplasmatota archaeon]|nr:2-amino-4-hydroxy-6-hydroxymethyldihydropteridine diphosphokinase [Candidatus Thermoplasmatota archaeon]
MPLVYLGLGSNMGEKAARIKEALDRLAKVVVIQRVSPFYLTEPVDLKDQAWFVNCVVEAQTEKEPDQLLKALQAIEKAMGRKKTKDKGPRPIDIDLLFYDDRVVHQKNLVIPHPKLHARLFVLQPMMDLNPQFVHPVLKKTIKELYDEQPWAEIVTPYR